MERKTRQRAAIRMAFDETTRPLGPQEVLDAARPHVPGLGIATVYRALKGMVEEGVLVRVELPGETPRYEPAGRAHHHHFRCNSCDRVFEVEGCPKDLAKLVPKGFEVEGHDVLLYGRCVSCLAA
jgi:Fur family transcriptional regulator, ferric uptake regulator